MQYIYLRSKADEMAFLIWRRNEKKLGKTINKNRVAQKKQSGQ